MVLKRYLLYFSYIGTYFRGVQRQRTRDCHDPSTVQGLIEYALERMNLKNKPKALIASRTDQGVHALKSALQVDLDFTSERTSNEIHYFLNRFFHDTDLSIRINDVLWVPWEFNCRKAPLWRRYVYRFAILKPNYLPEEKVNKFTIPIPISEHNRCYFVLNTNFNYEAVKKAAELFVGTRDYVAFLGKPNSNIHDDNLSTVRCLHRVFVEPTAPYIPSSLNDCFDFYHLTCEGKSFIYNQVRKIVAILLAVGQGEIDIYDVEQMFIEPSPATWPNSIHIVPSDGLYLTDVFYDPKDLALPNDIKDFVKNPIPETPKEARNREKYEKSLWQHIQQVKECSYDEI